MNAPFDLHIQQAVEALRAAHDAALQPFVERNLPHQNFTMYQPAMEELADKGTPDTNWDHWMLVSVVHGLLALPNHAEYADLILHTLNAIKEEHGCIPPMVATGLSDYLLPTDTWIVPLFHRLVMDVVATPCPASFTNEWLRDRLGMERTFGVLGIIQTLGTVHNAETVDVLLAALRYPDPQFQRVAVESFGALRASAALQPLMDLARQRPQPHLIKALGKLRMAEATPLLLDILGKYRAEQAMYFGDYTEMVTTLIEALAQSGDPQIKPHIAPFLDVPNEAVNMAAARALHRLGDDRGVDVLREMLDDEDLGDDAARYLAQNDDPAALAAGIDAYLNDPNQYSSRKRDTSSRAAHIRELARSGDLSDIPFLRWVEDRDFVQTDQGWSIAEAASRAIAHIEARHRR